MTAEVLALVDDSAAGAAVIDCSAALAQALQRELSLVYVESTLALQAAALPIAQVLSHAGAAWSPFDPQDLERGWRAQAARMRTLAQDLAARRAVTWSLRTVRGRLPQLAMEWVGPAGLLVIGGCAMASTGAAALPPRRRLAVLDDGSAAAARARDLAVRLAQTLPATLQVLHVAARDDAAAVDALIDAARGADALVLPHGQATPPRLARLRSPVLLVA
jgi:nucleotide-binding universal stress UspA family protein